MFEKLKEWYLGHNRQSIANKASSLLNDEAFLIAKESLQESLLQEFISSKANESYKREDIYKSYILIEHITQEIAKLMYSAEQL